MDNIDEKKDPTPIMESENIEVEKPKKNFSKKFQGRGKPAGLNVILPSHRQIFQNYKDQGFRNLGKAIRQTGVYSETVASRVNKITSTKSWQTLMQEYMPEEHLARRHSELLDKREWRKVENEDGTITEVDNGPETAAVTKGLELAYRLRGSFSKDEAPAKSTVMYNLFYKPEVREQMKAFEDGIKLSLLHEINKRNLADIEAEEENQANIERVGPDEYQEDAEQPGTDTA